jgi:acetoacetyl-CoA synthetase
MSEPVDHAEAAPIWTPSAGRIDGAVITRFARELAGRAGLEIRGYDELYRYSIDRPAEFWSAVWDFCGVRASERGREVVRHLDRMPGAEFFPDARLNFAENLLRRRDERDALVFQGEGRVRRRMTFRELYDAVSRMAQAFRAAGLAPGDRVGGYVPNVPEAIVAALAAHCIGAVWSSCSPDFGVQGVLDRFGQIEPRLLVSADGYFFRGEAHDSLDKLREVVRALPSVERVVVIPYTREAPPLEGLDRAIPWADFVDPFTPRDIRFEQLPFDHPVYILYSSGTTGAPKCIVHGAGGTLLQHLKEHRLHCDIRPDDRVFYFTTCGWMMWNWLVSVLASEATLLLYDGSPFHPEPQVLFDLADAEGMTLFGTSAKYLDAARKAGLAPIRTHRLASMRTMTSTGSPLAPESFDYVYESIKPDLHLASISGGTDIVSCFVGGNPAGPVWRGEIQVPALGMKVDVFDERGRPVRGEKGELVCTMPFPSMPVRFWNDPDGAKYRRAYFEKFPGVWAHGDYAAFTAHGGIVIYGRSDAVLNPGGVRIGTAEIYRQVEQLDEVLESLVIGQQWNGDERIVLFVRLREGLALDAALVDRIRDRIRRNTTPRHVPAKVVQVAEIPRTKSGKIVELAVRDVVHGLEPTNREALANPEALALYKDIPELKR